MDNNQLDKITINGQDFELYTDIFSLDTMTWTKEPTRSLDGSMPDINDIDRFPVPRVWLDFGYITIKDYRRLLTAINVAEFNVTYYNLETDSIVTHRMYVHPLDRYKIHNKGASLLGIVGVGITLIGTLNTVDTYSITYDGNGALSGAVGTQTGLYGDVLIIHDKGTLVKNGYVLTSWNTAADGTGNKFIIGQKLVLTGNMSLYAQWEQIEVPLNILEINSTTTINVPDYNITAGDWAAFMFYIRRNADVAVTWQNVSNWAYGEIPLLPVGKVQKVSMETTNGTTYNGTAGNYFDEV